MSTFSAEKLLNIDQIVELLGVSKATIYSWTSKKKIPHIKLSNGIVKFRMSKILEWLEEKSVNVSGTDTHGFKLVEKKRSYRKGRSIADSAIDRIVENAKKTVLV